MKTSVIFLQESQFQLSSTISRLYVFMQVWKHGFSSSWFKLFSMTILTCEEVSWLHFVVWLS